MEKNENEITEDSPFYVKHLFGTMVFFSIIIALTLVMVSMSLYYSSGSSQLDLSSPGYIDVRDQIEDEKKYFFRLSDENKLDFPNFLPSPLAGLYGYVGYEMVRFYEKLPKRAALPPEQPPGACEYHPGREPGPSGKRHRRGAGTGERNEHHGVCFYQR